MKEESPMLDQKTEERIIIGGWFRGIHLEDVPAVAPNIMWYSTTAQAFLNANLENYNAEVMLDIIHKIDRKLPDVVPLMEDYNKWLYESAVTKVQRNAAYRKAKSMLEAGGNSEELRSVLGKIIEDLAPRSASIESENMFVDFMEELDKRAKTKPLRFNIPTLDRIMGGCKPSELTVIAARPSVGKTTLALQFAEEFCKQGRKVLFLSLEQAREAIVERMVMRHTNIEANKLRSGKLETSDWEQLNTMFDEMTHTDKHLLLTGEIRDFTDIMATCKEEKIEVLIIDQLSKLRAKKRFQSVRERFSYMTNNLQSAAVELGIPIILLAQINRDATGSVPTLANLKESGSIEEDADNVLILHTPKGDESYIPVEYKGLNGLQMIDVAKQRNGETLAIFVQNLKGKYTIRELTKEEA